jgi:Peptidase family M50
MTSGRGRLIPGTALVFVLGVAVLVICELVARAHDLLFVGLFLWFVVGRAIGTACHEVGHLLCAAIGSIPIHRMVVGHGPLLWRGRFGETWLELRLLPFGGHVAPYPAVNYRWCWRALFLSGGVLANVAVICLVAALRAAGVAPGKAGQFLGAIVFAQLYIIVRSLIPSWDNRRVNDGLLLLQLLRQSRDYPAEARAAYAMCLSGYGNGSPQPTMTLASARLLYHVSLTDRTTDEEARRDFREALLRELERGHLVREERILALDALVTDGLISGDPTARASLDEWSQQALELGPELPTLLGSRGAVLVVLGRYEEGRALLAPIAAVSQARPFDAIMSQAFLARAERALGDEAAARQFANGARTTAEAIQVMPRVAAMLTRLDTEMQL